MSTTMDEEIKRWTARRKSVLVLEIIQGKITVAEASRQFDIPPSEIENWVEDGKRGMENALPVGSTPFPQPARRFTIMMFNITSYTRMLMSDFQPAGGKIICANSPIRASCRRCPSAP